MKQCCDRACKQAMPALMKAKTRSRGCLSLLLLVRLCLRSRSVLERSG
jgi:hypothetical protein